MSDKYKTPFRLGLGWRIPQLGTPMAFLALASWPRFRSVLILVALSLAGVVIAMHHLRAQAADGKAASLQASFAATARPFLEQNCAGCHKGDAAIAGLRVDQLTGAMDEQQMETWERVYRRVANGTMPPANTHQPSSADRLEMTAWMDHALEYARTRPTPKNGLVRRLTVMQYKNTLRQLLMLDDDVGEILPPDAVSKEGFLNNQERLELSPQLTEDYFEVADRALSRVITDPKEKPTIENFRVDLGAGINRDPIKERLILSPASFLLEPENFTVTQLVPKKPFAFKPFAMTTKLRFVEGYVGNATVRGWKDYDSIYHTVFADFRGSNGYPKGRAWDSVPEGLLLRPAIPSENANGGETNGPKANFKIALRELPDDGRFRVTVTAARYNDGLLLDKGATARPGAGDAITVTDANPMATIKQAGVYQVDVYRQPDAPLPAPDASRLAEGLVGDWNFEDSSWKLTGETVRVATPFGHGIHFGVETDKVAVPYADALNVGTGEFTVTGWIKVGNRAAGIISSKGEAGPGWVVESNIGGGIQFLSYGPDGKSNGIVVSNNGVLLNSWQHFAVTVGRGAGQTRLYVDGVLVGRGTTGPADIGYKGDTLIGASPGQESYLNELDDFRFYRRALGAGEIRALATPKVELPKPTPRFGRTPEAPAPEVKLDVGNRQFTGGLQQPAFLVLRLEAGSYPVKAAIGTMSRAAQIVLTPLEKTNGNYQRFAAYEKRTPKIGLYMGFRRDCGDTMIQVGKPQDVAGTNLQRFVFEGALRNYPNPDVNPATNVNYIAGIRQIGVRSEYTDGRDMPRLLIRAVEFEGPYYDQWPTAAYKNIFGVTGSEATQARKIIRRFATQAFRRPITPGEEETLYGIYRASAARGRGFRDSVKDALLVTLTTPQFLFLVEKSATPAAEPLDGYELASKLSYFLWNGPPDQRLLQLAAAGTLRGQLNAEVKRMLADAKFSGFLGEFVPQWLNLDKFQVLEPDRRQFPDLTHATRAQLAQEPVEYMRYLVAHNLPASNLVKSDFVVMNEAVAGYYGLGDKVGSGFQFVAIKPDRPDLGGLMTDAAVLSGLSDGRESNPVRRGAWLARKIIAEPPPNPPPNVPPLPEDSKGLTLRQRIEQHRSAPACRSCHSRIDPWGIALEGYDAGGRLKKTAADAKSTLPDGTEVGGMNDLKQYLAGPRMDQVAFSILKHLTTYAAGRSLSYAELDYLKRDGLKLKKNGYRLQDMIEYVTASPMFLEK